MNKSTTDSSAKHTNSLRARATELVYGETLRLAGQFFVQRSTENSNDGANFVKELRHHFDELHPIDGDGEQRPFVLKDLKKTDYVLLRHDGPKRMLQLPYVFLNATVLILDSTLLLKSLVLLVQC